MKTKGSKKKRKGLRRLGRNRKDPRRRKSEDKLELNIAISGGFPWATPGNFPGRMPGMGWGMPGMPGMLGLNEITSDPEVLTDMQVSKVMTAF